jgi:hypothetical protein
VEEKKSFFKLFNKSAKVSKNKKNILKAIGNKRIKQ